MASKPSFAAESTKSEVLKLPPVILRKELHTLIGTVKEMQLITTYEEVLEGLGKYIVEKKLFDEHNPRKVCCKNDELGAILGIEEFTVTDMKTLLQKIVVPVCKTFKDSAEGVSLHSDNPLKRKLDESLESDQRKVLAVDVELHSSPLVFNLPPSPNFVDGSDSVDSVQGYETAYVKDTSDDLQSPENPNGEEQILAIEETYNIEYEVDSDSSNSTLYADSSDSELDTDPNSMVLLNAAILSFLSKPESDIEFFADDSSDDDSDNDMEITENDFWKCKTCGVSNQPPMRYCLRCFNERLNWLPDNLRKQRKPRKSAATIDKDANEASLSKSGKSSQENRFSSVSCEVRGNASDPSSDVSSTNVQCVDSPSVESINSPGMISTDSPQKAPGYLSSLETTGSQSINFMPPPAESIASTYFQPLPLDCMQSTGDPSSMEPTGSFCMKSMGSFFNSSSIESSSGSSSTKSSGSSIESLGTSSMESLVSSSMESSGPSSLETGESTTKLCIICCASPAAASIIHGKYAHQISCYKCARMLQKQKQGCPVCRRTIDRVVHQINM